MVLSAHQLPPPTPLPLTSPSPLPLLPLPYTMSQPDYPAIIWQLQEQIAVLTVPVGEAAGRGESISAVTEVAKPQTFDGIPSKVSRFVGAYRLYIKMRLRDVLVEE